ncbi:MAG: DNA polymerase Y family protein [Flavipsychrobacter sp.]|nr:DNA polymerase Y family protein [Flavipsychrobacter sp.]
MPKRFVAIWFRHLSTDWFKRKQPELKEVPFVLAAPERGRMVVKAVSQNAHERGIYPEMVVADCRAIYPTLKVIDEIPGKAEQLLTALAEWCLRYTPVAAIDLPDGVLLDVSGCPHLWGGEQAYLKDIFTKLEAYGYDVRIAIADTIGAAWALSRYGNKASIVKSGQQLGAILQLTPSALRIDASIADRLSKLGLYTIQSFIKMPRSALRRRFGQSLLMRLDQALGQEMEILEPVKPIQPYQERLPCLEPIRTATGIEIALKQLLEKLCQRLAKEELGLRTCIFKCYRMDGNIQQIGIGTNRASRNVEHLFKLFEIKIATLEPDLGFEVFILEAPKVETISTAQDALWNSEGNHDQVAIAELLDKLAGKVSMDAIHRYLPAEHYWPERSITTAISLEEKPTTNWRTDLPRPIQLLPNPELIEVTVQLPDYPPMLFKYKGKLHHVKKADGPERIEQEWWIAQDLYRDYYCIEDETGARYWLFRLGHYANGEPKWFIHGFFA